MPLLLPLDRRAEVPLTRLGILVIDCQATAASPRGHLLEIGWACVEAGCVTSSARVIRPAAGQRVPPAVTRVTGITDALWQDGTPASTAWREVVSDAASLAEQPAPTVIHFARFERPFLESLAAGAGFRFDIVCTHEIARRLLPDLPRCSLRALAGYFGRGVGVLRRSADHVEATAFVWRQLVPLLESEGIWTWAALHDWLAAPREGRARRRRAWPLARDLRLSLPDAPGVYRLLRTGGDVVYVGKASSLRHRVNSYFRHRRGVPERMLEMLSQVRDVSFDVAASALEAALLEPDEIKRHRPPYNIALTEEGRTLWFASRDLRQRRVTPSRRCPVGPFPSADVLEQFAALVHASPLALGAGRWGPTQDVFEEGYHSFCTTHEELAAGRHALSARLLRLGTRLWREGRRDKDEDAETDRAEQHRARNWTPDLVRLSLERLALRAALARRRARWFTFLIDASIAWREPGSSVCRVFVLANGESVLRGTLDPGTGLPVPPGHHRVRAARLNAFDVPRFDRVRVLTTELKRLVSVDALVQVRFGARPPLSGSRLARVLWWL